MRTSRLLAASAALVLTMTGVFAPASHSAPISGRDWVATPNGLVGVQQMVIVRASGQAGAMAVVTFQNTSAGTNAGQAAVNSQGFAYLPWQPGAPGAWNISANGWRIRGRNCFDRGRSYAHYDETPLCNSSSRTSDGHFGCSGSRCRWRDHTQRNNCCPQSIQRDRRLRDPVFHNHSGARFRQYCLDT